MGKTGVLIPIVPCNFKELTMNEKRSFLEAAVTLLVLVVLIIAGIWYFNRAITPVVIPTPIPAISLQHPLTPPAAEKMPPAPAAVAKPAPKALAKAKTDMERFEALWTAGGPNYQAAVRRMADKYFAEMNKETCLIPLHAFDFTDAIKAAKVQSPSDELLVKKQVATLGCSALYETRKAVQIVASLSL